VILRKSLLRRKPRPDVDKVSPGLRLAVFARDGGCMAPSLGGDVMDCWGRLTAEHVKSELRAAKRAESDMAHLIALCEGHTEPGAKGGRQWNTAKQNRTAVRGYLILVTAGVPRALAARQALAASGICLHVEPVASCAGPCNRARAS
jgi:hypothetical protein